MESKFISALFKPSKADILFKTAMGMADSVKALMSLNKESAEGITFENNIFHKVFPNDPNSPAIYWLEDSQYVIYYPPNSTPYAHSFDEKCKFIEVLSGVIFDANSDMKLFKGERIKVYPKDNYAPYTMEKPCYLRVCVGSCESLLDQVCK